MTDGRQLDADAWKEVLSRLGDEIGSPPIEVFVIGGAAMALTFHERRTTQDVDVVINSDEDRDRILACVGSFARPESVSMLMPPSDTHDAAHRAREGRRPFHSQQTHPPPAQRELAALCPDADGKR